MILSRGKSRNIPKFNYNGLPLEVVTDHRYLSIDFNYNGKFKKCKKHHFDQAQRAMYSLLKKSKNLCLPIDVQLYLFDHMIAPILLHGSWVWGCENNNIVERLLLKFCRMLLGVNNNISKCMVYGESGRATLQANVDQNVLNFWAKIVNANDKQFSITLYHVMYKLNKTGLIKSDWILYVKNCLNNCNLYNHWITQNINQFKNIVKKSIHTKYKDLWSSDIFNNSKCYNYKMFKSEYGNIFVKLPVSFRISLTKFRVSNHKFGA